MNQPILNEWGLETQYASRICVRSAQQLRYEAAERERAKGDPLVVRWRKQGGLVGELRRRAGLPEAAVGHIPFPGHRHCGEW